MGLNPYETLGVSKDAGEDEIKTAYRKLAKQYHPDVNRNNLAAEQKFKGVSEAYQILSDKQARRFYDKAAQKTATAAEAPRWRPAAAPEDYAPGHIEQSRRRARHGRSRRRSHCQ